MNSLQKYKYENKSFVQLAQLLQNFNNQYERHALQRKQKEQLKVSLDQQKVHNAQLRELDIKIDNCLNEIQVIGETVSRNARTRFRHTENLSGGLVKSNKTAKKIKIQKLTLMRSTNANKKYMAKFEYIQDQKLKKKTIHFGQSGAEDYTIHHDKARLNRYIGRHHKNENWNNPLTAGSLSKYILWNKPTIRGSVCDFKKKFKIKKVINNI